MYLILQMVEQKFELQRINIDYELVVDAWLGNYLEQVELIHESSWLVDL